MNISEPPILSNDEGDASSAPASAAARRPIKARNSRWAGATATWMARSGVTPNAISVFSIACSAVAGGALVSERFVEKPLGRAGLYVLAIVGIQSRLICNLLDGMVAVEGGKKSKTGEIYNDFPDRIADPLILAAAGYAASSLHYAIELGWLAAVLAMMTAYVRVLGRSLGAGIYFIGPMAKQHRMGVLTAACVFAIPLCWWNARDAWTLFIALIVICIGAVVTVIRRTKRIASDLERR